MVQDVSPAELLPLFLFFSLAVVVDVVVDVVAAAVAGVGAETDAAKLPPAPHSSVSEIRSRLPRKLKRKKAVLHLSADFRSLLLFSGHSSPELEWKAKMKTKMTKKMKKKKKKKKKKRRRRRRRRRRNRERMVKKVCQRLGPRISHVQPQGGRKIQSIRVELLSLLYHTFSPRRERERERERGRWKRKKKEKNRRERKKKKMDAIKIGPGPAVTAVTAVAAPAAEAVAGEAVAGEAVVGEAVAAVAGEAEGTLTAVATIGADTQRFLWEPCDVSGADNGRAVCVPQNGRCGQREN